MMPPGRTAKKRLRDKPQPFRVFVSHATADKWIAREICEKIKAIPGVIAFRDDRDIGGGSIIPEVIRDEIRRTDQFVVLVTPTSIVRTWVILEIGMAYAFERLIVPICYNTPVDSISLLTMMKGYQLDNLEHYIDDLRRRVKEREG
jgi:TIR domain